MLSSLTPLKQQMAFQSFSGFPLLIALEETLVTQAAESCVFRPLPPFPAAPLQAGPSSPTSRGTVLFQAPAAGLCSSRHQPRDSALPGTGILHLLLSRARKVLSSFLRYGNPLRPPALITPLCAGAHALQSPFTGCEAETVSNACLAILPQQGLPVVQLPHL